MCLLAPIIISILAIIIFQESLNKVNIIGFCIATIGSFFLVTGGDLKTLTPESPNFLGYLFALIMLLLWSIYTTITKKLTKTKSNLKTLKYVSYFGTLELFLFVVISNEFQIFVKNIFNLVLVLCTLHLGLIYYVIGYFVWQKSQTELKSSKVASFLYIEPFFTFLFSFLLQRKETILLLNIVGGIIVLDAILIINYK